MRCLLLLFLLPFFLSPPLSAEIIQVVPLRTGSDQAAQALNALPSGYGRGVKIDPSDLSFLPPLLSDLRSRAPDPHPWSFVYAPKNGPPQEFLRNITLVTEALDSFGNPSSFSDLYVELPGQDPEVSRRMLDWIQGHAPGSLNIWPLSPAGTPKVRASWIAEDFKDIAERLSFLALSSGCSTLLLDGFALEEDSSWLWQNMAPLTSALPMTSVLAHPDTPQSFSEILQRTNLPSIGADWKHPSCKLLFILGAPDSDLTGLARQVRQGLTVCVFASNEMSDSPLKGLDMSWERNTSSKSVPPFILPGPAAQLKSWHRARLANFHPPQHLSVKRHVEAISPDGRDAAWSWSMGHGRVILFAGMPLWEDPQWDAQALVTSVANSASCPASARAPQGIQASWMESQGRHVLLVYADGIPGSLMKSRGVLSWAEPDRPYSVWSLPGPIWVGQWPGTELSGEGLPLTLEPGHLRIFEISETP